MSITTSLVSQQILLHTNIKPKQNILCYQPLISHQTLSKFNISYTLPRKHTRLRAAATDVPADVAVNVAPTEASQQIVSSGGGDDGVSSIISALLLIAFVALTILTIGVVYIAVADFLQKREKDKFEKEEAERLKKKGGKKKVGARAKAGPRGFGQKIEDFDD
ncbi:hypothetical protein vseg_013130 [Gypsophila vaccaria]